MKKIGCVNHDCEKCQAQATSEPVTHTAAMRLALSMLHFMNDNGYRLEEHEQGRMDSAIAALEKELGND